MCKIMIVPKHKAKIASDTIKKEAAIRYLIPGSLCPDKTSRSEFFEEVKKNLLPSLKIRK